MQPDPPTVGIISTIVYMDGRKPIDDFGYTCLMQAMHKRARALNKVILGPVHHRAGTPTLFNRSVVHVLTAPVIDVADTFDS